MIGKMYKHVSLPKINAIRIGNNDVTILDGANGGFTFLLIDENGDELDYVGITRPNTIAGAWFMLLRKKTADLFYAYDKDNGLSPVPIGISNNPQVLSALAKAYNKCLKSTIVEGEVFESDQAAQTPNNQTILDRLLNSKNIYPDSEHNEHDLTDLMP